MRIGILKTDSVRPEFQAQFGDYPTMFRAVLSSAADGEPVEFRDYDVQHGQYPERLEECDAYLITGSRESVYDELPWLDRLKLFVKELDAARHPLVGICFGHQLIAQELGGETRAAEVGWSVGVHEAEVIAPGAWMQPFKPSFRLLSSHKDQVVQLPPRARPFAASDAGKQLPVLVGGLIRTLMGLLGIIFVVLMVYAGFLWMTARGDKGTVDKAKDIIRNSIIGIILIFLAYAITGFVVNAIVTATTK